MYKYKITRKIVEIISFTEGCLPTDCAHEDVTMTISAPTLRRLVQSIGEKLDVEENCILLNACGDAGRIDVQKLENWRGETPSKQEFEKWKGGEIQLFAATYSGIVVCESIAELSAIGDCGFEEAEK